MTWLALLTGLVKLVMLIVQAVHDNGLIATGEKDAIADSMSEAATSLRTARAAEAAGDAAHAADPTDGAFDQSFKRQD